MTNQSLFPDPAPSIEQHIQQLDAAILWLLTGHTGGPLNLALTDEEKVVLAAIRYARGAANAFPIRDIRKRESCAHLSERAIKKAVRTLRMQFRLPIGSSKQADGGYFIVITDADRQIYRSQVLDQVRAELEVLKAVDGPKAALELLGQLSLEVA